MKGFAFAAIIAAGVLIAACSSAPAPTAQPAAPTAAPTTAPPPPAPPTAAPTTAKPASDAASTAAKPAAAPTSAPAPAKAQPAAESSADLLAMLKRSDDARAAAKSFRMKMVGTAQPGQHIESLMEVSCPDRMRMKSSVAGQSVELVSIGGESYMNAAGQWMKSPGQASVPVPCGASGQAGTPGGSNSAPIGFSGLPNDVKIAKGGVTQVEGAQCQEWTFTLPPQQGLDMSYTACIGVADQLLRQIKMLDGRMTITLYDWNVPITIERPM